MGFVKEFRKVKDGKMFFYFKFVIFSSIQNYVDCPAEEVLSVLKNVLYEWGGEGKIRCLGWIFPWKSYIWGRRFMDEVNAALQILLKIVKDREEDYGI